MKHKLFTIIAALFLGLIFINLTNAQTSGFTFQGKLSDGGNAANATYQFEFKLYDANNNQVGNTISDISATVTNGIFTVNLDFGASAFDGAARFLEIGVRPNGNAQSYTVLNPRQAVASTPYAIRSLNANQANTANNSLNLDGVPAAQYVQTADTRLTNDRNPTAGSPNYIQNTTSPQASSNFNISGEGKANIFSAAAQFNLGANRILHATGTDNLFVGVDAGKVTTGGYNAFFGARAGQLNTTGFNNAFFGHAAGINNKEGQDNSFFGNGAGFANTTGSYNAFFGSLAGSDNMTGTYNSFFGNTAGAKNTIGIDNAFFGHAAGFKNTQGNQNMAFGTGAGINNTTGGRNTFVGYLAGAVNTTENDNTFLGYKADGAAGITNATAIGANAKVTASNSMVLGTSAVTVQIPGNLNIAGNLTGGNIVKNFNGLMGNVTLAAGSNITITPQGNTLTIASTGGSVNAILNQTTQQAGANFNVAGTGTANIFNAATQFNLGGTRVLHATGTDNVFVGREAGNSIAAGGDSNAFFGMESGKSNTTGFNNTFVGAYAGRSNTIAGNNAFFGANTGLSNNTGNFNAFFGSNAGFTNTSGSSNAFFGSSSGLNHSIGSNNSFFGRSAGASVTNALNNSFFGAYAGENTTTGGNAYFGAFAGQKNTSGFGNVFVGSNAGKENTGGSSNTFVGVNSGQNQGAGGSNNTALGANAKVNLNVNNATAIGANAFASQSNTLVLGVSGVKTIVEGDLEVKGTTSFQSAANVTSVTTNSLNVGNGVITASPNNDVVFNESLEINGAIFVTAQASFGSTTVSTLGVKSLGVGTDALCYSDNNPQVPLNPKVLAKCSSSRRYKENIQDFKPGIDLVKNLRPVTFDWVTTKHRDIGFVAEEVAEAEPLLATRNFDGQIEGVKYAQITTALVNAVKEQQTQIEQQQQQIKQQQLVIDGLKKFICSQNSQAGICKENIKN
jgi:hypothetical protein